MKIRKFKIKILSSDSRPGDPFKKGFIEAWKLAEKKKLESAEHELVITFPDISWLSRIFSPERMRIILTLRDQKPESIYQLAKLLGRIPANVHRDVHELADLGIIQLRKFKKKGQKRESILPEYNWDGFDIAV